MKIQAFRDLSELKLCSLSDDTYAIVVLSVRPHESNVSINRDLISVVSVRL